MNDSCIYNGIEIFQMQCCCIYKNFTLYSPQIKSMAKGIIAWEIKCRIGTVLTFLLLVLYIAGTSHQVLHSFVHDHDAELDSAEEEADLCQRLVYDKDKAQGCDHESHLIVSDKCQMCDLACNADHIAFSESALSSGEFLSEHFKFYKTGFDSYCAVISSSRAPPALI